jgi:divalent metal cation (Fe/Co/Zn/Cd) transporter
MNRCAGCLREVNKARAGKSLWRWFRDSRQSELIVVFGEDLAALLGLGFALCAVLATMFSGNPIWDAWGSIAIGALLCVVAVFVAREVASLLVGQSAEPGLREVERLFNLITLQLGPDVMVATKAQMRGQLSGAELIDAINRVEAAMRARYPEIRWSFFEPDISD